MHFDVIVIGAGGVGSAAAMHLAVSGKRVLVLDRFPAGHDRGSSHGQTRIIRLAYFEHPDYVPLLRRAYALWRQLESESQRSLYFPVGLIEVGPPDGIVIPGIRASASRHGLDLRRIDDGSFQSEFPGFELPDGFHAYFESQAGYLLVEDSVLAHLSVATRHGAICRLDDAVVDWRRDGNGIRVKCERNEYVGERLVIAAGAWADSLLRDLGLGLEVRRKHLHWYACDTSAYQAARGAPCFFYETHDGCFYGFPQIDGRGLKIAEHSGGVPVHDPLDDSRDVDRNDRERVERFLRRNLPQVSNRPTGHSVCYYTMSRDENFIVDIHPEIPQVCFAAGLSGHGFKFTSVLGEILCELSLEGKTRHPIEFLRTSRFG